MFPILFVVAVVAVVAAAVVLSKEKFDWFPYGYMSDIRKGMKEPFDPNANFIGPYSKNEIRTNQSADYTLEAPDFGYYDMSSSSLAKVDGVYPLNAGSGQINMAEYNCQQLKDNAAQIALLNRGGNATNKN